MLSHFDENINTRTRQLKLAADAYLVSRRLKFFLLRQRLEVQSLLTLQNFRMKVVINQKDTYFTANRFVNLVRSILVNPFRTWIRARVNSNSVVFFIGLLLVNVKQTTRAIRNWFLSTLFAIKTFRTTGEKKIVFLLFLHLLSVIYWKTKKSRLPVLRKRLDLISLVELHFELFYF